MHPGGEYKSRHFKHALYELNEWMLNQKCLLQHNNVYTWRKSSFLSGRSCKNSIKKWVSISYPDNESANDTLAVTASDSSLETTDRPISGNRAVCTPTLNRNAHGFNKKKENGKKTRREGRKHKQSQRGPISALRSPQ